MSYPAGILSAQPSLAAVHSVVTRARAVSSAARCLVAVRAFLSSPGLIRHVNAWRAERAFEGIEPRRHFGCSSRSSSRGSSRATMRCEPRTRRCRRGPSLAACGPWRNGDGNLLPATGPGICIPAE
ncbi:hypothetical protein FKP32DRAFT_1588326 [Trametes sanguinea]|nr:hypothetical protein FKP32DRAFT_1588326 [Trametes sanguinea]